MVINHDYGGKDALAYQTAGGQGVPGADVRVFCKSDYDDGKRSREFIVARTRTGAGGRWTHPVSLPPGQYVLVFSAPKWGPDARELTVA